MRNLLKWNDWGLSENKEKELLYLIRSSFLSFRQLQLIMKITLHFNTFDVRIGFKKVHQIMHCIFFRNFCVNL